MLRPLAAARPSSVRIRVLAVAALFFAAGPLTAWSEGFDPWTQKARYEFEYRVKLASLPEGRDTRVWIPAPADTPSQRLLSTEVDSPWPFRVSTDSNGNRMIFAAAEGADADASDLVARFVVERSPSSGSDEPVLDPSRYLGARRRIPLDGVIGDIAADQTRGLTSDGDKIRAVYDYVVRTMRFDSDLDGPGDAVRACTEQAGDCTDFHSLFIGMARSQGIPARFVMGFSIPSTETSSEVPDYHCWAEVYQSDRGWIPIDAAEAVRSSQADAYFGHIPSDRIEFSVGRDLTLSPPQRGGPANYFIYPYVEVDRKVVPDVPARFRFIRFPG